MWWEILKIQREATLKEVKRAYAKLIKDAYQSGNQEEIIRIQNAYQSACDYIKAQSEDKKEVFKPSVEIKRKKAVFTYNEYERTNSTYDYKEENVYNKYHQDQENKSNSYQEVESDKVKVSELSNEDNIEFYNEESEAHEDENIKWKSIENHELESGFIYEDKNWDLAKCKDVFDPIYTDMKKRFDIEVWKELLGAFSFNDEEYFQIHAYEYFNNNYQLPYEIWCVIDEYLKLSTNPEFIWTEKIIYDDKFEYYPYEGRTYEELEEFFILRNKACEAYLNWEHDKTLNLCNEARKIYSKAPVIIKLKGLCNFDLGNYKSSYECFEELKCYEKYEVEAKRYMAEIYLKNNEFKKASILFKEIDKKDDGTLTARGRIKALKGQNKKLKSFFAYRYYGTESRRDKLLKYKFATKFERLLLKNNFFRISSFYNEICYLRDVLLYLGSIVSVFLICVGIVLGLIFVFYKVAIGILILYLIRTKIKKGGK